MPERWNLEEASYTLRYVYNKEIYLFHASVPRDGDVILINLFDGKSYDRAGLLLVTNEIVTAMAGEGLDVFFKDSKETIKRMTDEVINPILKHKKKLITRFLPSQKQRGGAGEGEANQGDDRQEGGAGAFRA